MKINISNGNDKLFPELSPSSAMLIAAINGVATADPLQAIGASVRSKKIEVARIVQAVQIGKEKKSKVVAMQEHGTKYQRELARKALKKL